MPIENNQVNLGFQQAQQIAQSGEAEFATQAAKELFQGIVSTARQLWDAQGKPSGFNPTLTLPAPTNPSDLGIVAGKLNGQAADGKGFNLTEIFTLLHEAALSMKMSNKELRQTQRDGEQSALQGSANKIRSMAGLTLASGLVSGCSQVVGGGVGFGGAVKAGATVNKSPAAQQIQPDLKMQQNAVKLSGKELNTQQKAVDAKQAGLDKAKADFEKTPTRVKQVQVERAKTQLDQSKAKLDRMTENRAQLKEELAQTETKYNDAIRPSGDKAQRISQKWQATSQMLVGVGSMIGSGIDYAAKLEEAAKTEADALAAVFRNLAQDSDERVKDAASHEQAVREKLSSCEESNNRLISTTLQV